MKHKSIGQIRRKRNAIIKTAVLVVAGIAVISVTLIIILNKNNDITVETLIESSDFEVVPALTSTPTPLPTLTSTPVPTDTPTPTPEPSYLISLDGYAPGTVIDASLIDTENLDQYFSIRQINEGDEVYQRIAGQSFVYNDDIALSDLRYLTLLHVNFDGNYQVGEMIVNASVAEQVTEIFEQLLEARYEIYSMYLIDDFWVGNGTDSDTNSIDHNNTSCFCYRAATGSSHISLHALGLAIDINPQQNPYVSIQGDGSLHFSHENAADYVYDRSPDTPHVITNQDLAYQLFTSYGWTWGGSWTNPIDYQHFQYE